METTTARRTEKLTTNTPGGKARARLANDSYFTIDKMPVETLLSHDIISGRCFDPCAGQGHLVAQLRGAGLVCSGQDLHHYDGSLVADMARGRDVMQISDLAGVDWVVSNLPYSDQNDIVRHLLPIAHRDACGVALLVRAPWHLAVSRRHLVHQDPFFAGIVVLPRRPIWIDPAEMIAAGETPKSPFHEYCWCIWGREPRRPGQQPSLFYPK
jgi:hypothetical protein